MTKYSLETKLEAVQAYLDCVESYKDAAQKHQSDPCM
nr:transposase [Shimazuella alba]